MARVVTYQAPRGDTIALTEEQVQRLSEACVWPRNGIGEEYCTPTHGLHWGDPDFTDTEIDTLIREAR